MKIMHACISQQCVGLRLSLISSCLGMNGGSLILQLYQQRLFADAFLRSTLNVCPDMIGREENCVCCLIKLSNDSAGAICG